MGAGGKQRTDSTHVISAVRDLNRLELAGESVRACRGGARGGRAGLAAHRDRHRRLGAALRGPGRHLAVADLQDQAGRAGGGLRQRRGDAAARGLRRRARAPPWLRELPAVEVLRRVLVQNYVITTNAAGREVIRAREADTDGLPPGRYPLDLAV